MFRTSAGVTRVPGLLGGVALGLLLAACGGGSGGNGSGTNPPVGGLPAPPDPCGAVAQRQFVFDGMQEGYLFQDLLPAGATPDSRATPAALLAYLTAEARARGMDRGFSYLTTRGEDQALFDEGQYLGIGFGVRVEGDQVRVTQVMPDGPADRGGFGRGDRILTINGRSITGAAAFESALASAPPPWSFVNRARDSGDPYTANLSPEVVTLAPVPTVRTFDGNGAPPVGYIDFRTFIAPAAERLNHAFAQFAELAVTDVIVDLRYNGGGRVDIANLLGDLLAGLVAHGEVFHAYRHNEQLSSLDREQRLGPLPLSLSTARVLFITTGASASASELMINGLDPHLEVATVGQTTYGKPVGQYGLSMPDCELLLRAVTFESVNALGEGGYYNGLPVSFGCAVDDDLEHDVGDPQEAMLAAALSWLRSGSMDCGIGAVGPPVMALRSSDSAASAGPPPEALAQRYYGLY